MKMSALFLSDVIHQSLWIIASLDESFLEYLLVILWLSHFPVITGIRGIFEYAKPGLFFGGIDNYSHLMAGIKPFYYTFFLNLVFFEGVANNVTQDVPISASWHYCVYCLFLTRLQNHCIFGKMRHFGWVALSDQSDLLHFLLFFCIFVLLSLSVGFYKCK